MGLWKPESFKTASRQTWETLKKWQVRLRAWIHAEIELAEFFYVRVRAEKGDPLNEYRFGLIYERGQYGLRSDYEAHKWFLRAAFKGLPEAQAKVSELYRSGRGVKKSDEEAFGWCRKAAEQGHAPSQVRLAQMYQNGVGVMRNPIEAKKWYNRAVTHRSKSEEVVNAQLALQAEH